MSGVVPVYSTLMKASAVQEKGDEADILTSLRTDYKDIRSGKHPSQNGHPHDNPVVDSKSSRKPCNENFEQSEKGEFHAKDCRPRHAEKSLHD